MISPAIVAQVVRISMEPAPHPEQAAGQHKQLLTRLSATDYFYSRALNPGGDRDANRALHMIAVVRLRYCERTRAYAERRRAEGKTNKEILRCLKRYIARQVYRTLVADLRAQPT